MLRNKIFISNCNNYDEVYSILKKPLKEIIKDELKKRKIKNVLIKINALMPSNPEKGITTNPTVVDAICRVLKQFKINIWIGDSSAVDSFGGSASALDVCGFKKIAEKYNAKLTNLDTNGVIEVKIPHGKILRKVFIAKPVLDADLIISVPKLKTHYLMGFTGAVKNFMGIIPGYNKAIIHKTAPSAKELASALLDIYQLVENKTICVFDAVVSMEGNGPNAGSLKRTNFIAVSNNCLCADEHIAKIIGFEPERIPIINDAILRHIHKLNNYEIDGLNIIRKLKKPNRYIKKIHKGKLIEWIYSMYETAPYIDKEKCKECNICESHCPANAIRNYKINLRKCILCYCCHELCPNKAIYLNKRTKLKVLESILKKLNIKNET